jgi:hypothetical protein
MPRYGKDHDEENPSRTGPYSQKGSASPSPYWNTITLPYAGTPVSICENDRVVAAKSDTEFGSLQTVSSIM